MYTIICLIIFFGMFVAVNVPKPCTEETKKSLIPVFLVALIVSVLIDMFIFLLCYVF